MVSKKNPGEHSPKVFPFSSLITWEGPGSQKSQPGLPVLFVLWCLFATQSILQPRGCPSSLQSSLFLYPRFWGLGYCWVLVAKCCFAMKEI